MVVVVVPTITAGIQLQPDNKEKKLTKEGEFRLCRHDRSGPREPGTINYWELTITMGFFGTALTVLTR